MSNPTVPVFTPEQIAGGEVSGPAATCSACNGTGRVPIVYPVDNEAQALAMAPECKSCDGTGEAIVTPSSAEALIKAIRTLTVDAHGGTKPNGPAELSLHRLGNALENHDMRRAMQHFRAMCIHMSDDLKALRTAAEAHFGGDFRAEGGTSRPCPGTYGDEEAPCGRRAGHGGDCGPASMDRARRAAHRGA